MEWVCRAITSALHTMLLGKKQTKKPPKNGITLQKISAHHCSGFSEPGEGRRKGNFSADAKRGSRLQLFKQWCLLAMPPATEQSCFPPLQAVNLQGLIYCVQKWVFSFQIQWQLWWNNGFVWKSCNGSRMSTNHEKQIWKWCFSLSDYSPVKSFGRFFCVVRLSHPLIILEKLPWIHSSMPMSLLCWETQHRHRNPGAPPQCWAEGKNSPPSPAGKALSEEHVSIFKSVLCYFSGFLWI